MNELFSSLVLFATQEGTLFHQVAGVVFVVFVIMLIIKGGR